MRQKASPTFFLTVLTVLKFKLIFIGTKIKAIYKFHFDANLDNEKVYTVLFTDDDVVIFMQPKLLFQNLLTA